MATPHLLSKSRGEGSNLQPMVYKTIALPLSYLGKMVRGEQNRC